MVATDGSYGGPGLMQLALYRLPAQLPTMQSSRKMFRYLSI